jgi:sec-independent protein translocase protein TatA
MELVVILAIVLVVFGAGRLPKLGEGLGKGLQMFRRGLSGSEAPLASPEVEERRDGQTTKQ